MPKDVEGIVHQHLATIKDGAEVEIAFFGGSFTGIDNDLQMSYLQYAPMVDVLLQYLKIVKVLPLIEMMWCVALVIVLL